MAASCLTIICSYLTFHRSLMSLSDDHQIFHRIKPTITRVDWLTSLPNSDVTNCHSIIVVGLHFVNEDCPISRLSTHQPEPKCVVAYNVDDDELCDFHNCKWMKYIDSFCVYNYIYYINLYYSRLHFWKRYTNRNNLFHFLRLLAAIFTFDLPSIKYILNKHI